MARAELSIQNIVIALADEVDGVERELAMLRTSNISLQLAQLKSGRTARFSLQSLTMEDRTPRPHAISRALRLLDSRPPPSITAATAAEPLPSVGSREELVHLL